MIFPFILSVYIKTYFHISGLEIGNTAVGIGRSAYATTYIRKSSPTSSGRSVGIVRSRTQATEFSFFF
jgi:hypothetical protein